ncbi:MAG: hypothetical protein LZ172_03475 [Thaumarchaeota archaeon]|jgi:hypothetical protein|nr:hypothetical protein [Candidatus Geocrenenecus arthurdayi]MCL7402500.1 hypothetical protein [Candidatus Geocrenenecus arthurdayi]MCL7403392.1 hypothetical protein [Candidatus Geocrenenecus arthurdayi]
MSREEHGLLEKRLRELEEEVRKMKEPLETTLMDIRQLISDLENPFNYIAKIVDLDKLQTKQVPKETGGIKKTSRIDSIREPTEDFEEISREDTGQRFEEPQRSQLNLLNILACGSILVKLLGRDHVVQFLNSRIVNQLAPRRLVYSLIDAVDFLLKYSEGELYIQSQSQISLDSIVAAAYIVSLLANNKVDDRFFILLMFGLKEPPIEFKNRKGVP